MAMKTEDVHLALGLPPPPAGEAVDEEASESGTDDETAEDNAIDALFEATDPAARREAFRTAVQLCMKGGY
jgi:hypothetical protein